MGCWSVLVTTWNFAIAQSDDRASPRNPNEEISARSSKLEIFEVKCFFAMTQDKASQGQGQGPGQRRRGERRMSVLTECDKVCLVDSRPIVNHLDSLKAIFTEPYI